ARGGIGADVEADQEQLVAEEAGVGVLQVRAALAERFDLAPREDQTRLVPLVDRVVVERAPVDADVALAALRRHPLALSPGPGTSARFSRMRYAASTKTTFGSCARAAASSSQV